MKISLSTSTLLTLALALAWPVAAEQTQTAQGQTQQGQTQTKPEPKPEPKLEAKPEAPADTTVAGKWTMNIESPNGAMQSALELKIDPKDAKKVAGSLESPMGTAAVEGELADGKLTFWITIDANGNNMAVTFVGTLQKDGSMAGMLSFGQGEIPWTAVRAKN